MAENSKIEWTDHTFNPWIGCTRVSPACDHCYAETWANRYGTVEWGIGKPRKLTSESNWQQPLKWNREAEKAGVRKRVFCASLADVFDNEADPAWRIRLFALIDKTPHLDWLLLTKRIGNAAKMLPMDWGDGWPNVWLGISVVNQAEANRDIPKLLNTKARIHFLSMEPLLGHVDLEYPTELFPDGPQRCCNGFECGCMGRPVEPPLFWGIDWVIVGGESGVGARPMNPEWARSLRDQCIAFGIAFHFKQWGEWAPYDRGQVDSALLAAPSSMDTPIQNFGKKLSGRMLDGRTWDGYPLQTTKGPNTEEDK